MKILEEIIARFEIVLPLVKKEDRKLATQQGAFRLKMTHLK